MRHTKTIILMIILTAILCFSAIVYRAFCGTPWEKASAQKAMQNYLDAKYSDKMIINSVHYSVDPTCYYGVAHPINNSKVSFDIYDTKGKIYDYYCPTLWGNQMKTFLLQNIDTKYLKNIDIKVSVLPDSSIYDNISGNVPNYKNIENSLYPSTEIDFECNFNFNNSNKESQYELMFNILTSIKKLQKFCLINFFYQDNNNQFTILYTDSINIKRPSDISKYHV